MSYNFPEQPVVTSQAEAVDVAISWQEWQSKQALGTGDLSEWHFYFLALAEEYGLYDEFKENAII